MTRVFYKSISAFGVGVLTACGGGTSTPVTVTPPPSVNKGVEPYTLLNERKAQTSAITGVLQGTTYEGENITSSLSGQLTHDTGSLSASSRIFSLSTSKDFRDEKVIKEGDITIKAIDLKSRYKGDYAFIHGFEYTQDVPNSQVNAGMGFAGIATKTNDMPTSGGAVYRGGAQAVLSIGGRVGEREQQVALTNGTSELTVNFDAANPNATLNMINFSAVSQSSSSPVDQVEIHNMAVVGGGITGGTIVTSLNGKTVDVLGGSTSSDVQALFYGYDTEKKRPDEAAGVFRSTGHQGVISGSFVVD